MAHESALGDLELDRCRMCDGLWFDGGELERWVTARGRQARIEPGASGLGLVPGTSARACPACLTLSLESRALRDSEVGYCAGCRGLFAPPELQQWLDRQAHSRASPLPGSVPLGSPSAEGAAAGTRDELTPGMVVAFVLWFLDEIFG